MAQNGEEACDGEWRLNRHGVVRGRGRAARNGEKGGRMEGLGETKRRECDVRMKDGRGGQEEELFRGGWMLDGWDAVEGEG